MNDPRTVRITGALVESRPLVGVSLYELVRVGARRLLGEIIRIRGDTGTIQVYEDTTGLRLGEPVEATGEALTIQLGPGLLGAVIDGVGRPLARLADATGSFMGPGATAPTLDPHQRWAFRPEIGDGDAVQEGDVIGRVEEKSGVPHRILIPPGTSGHIAEIAAGSFTVDEPVGQLADGTPLTLAHRWPVRQPRPVGRRLALDRPLITGQRVLDFLFPVAEGGTVAVPGGFGTGKTVIEQSLAKYADADVVVYIGCGERGNEMAEVLEEFPELVDPETGRSVMDRTVLVVNTSNMPVAAREASVYVGVTVAEYYRDMGLRVAVMADSLSRWAEALREMSARLQEMPGEEGYPTYLGNRLAKWYERAGRITAAGKPERTGALSIISAVSPPGGDFSEPVTQASLRVTGALWALDAGLAHQRQFPAVDWETSYTLYERETADWFAREVAAEWPVLRRQMLELLGRDRELRDIAALVGHEGLQDRDRLLLEIAQVVREVILGQNAYDPNDAWSSTAKTYRLVTLVHLLYQTAEDALAAGVALEQRTVGALRQHLVALRHASVEEIDELAARVEAEIRRLPATVAGTARSARAPAEDGRRDAGSSVDARMAPP